MVSTSAQIGRDWYLAYWTDDSEHNTVIIEADAAAAASSFLALFALLTLAFVLLTFLRAIMLVMVGYYCSISLHNQVSLPPLPPFSLSLSLFLCMSHRPSLFLTVSLSLSSHIQTDDDGHIV